MRGENRNLITSKNLAQLICFALLFSTSVGSCPGANGFGPPDNGTGISDLQTYQCRKQGCTESGRGIRSGTHRGCGTSCQRTSSA